jgi:hypothetical protein
MVELIPIEDLFALRHIPHHMFRTYLLTGPTTRAFIIIDLWNIRLAHGDGVKGAVARTCSIAKAGIFTATGPVSDHESGAAIICTKIFVQERFKGSITTASSFGKFHFPVHYGKAHDFCDFLRRLLSTHDTDIDWCPACYYLISGSIAAWVPASATVCPGKGIFYHFNPRVHIDIKDL